MAQGHADAEPTRWLPGGPILRSPWRAIAVAIVAQLAWFLGGLFAAYPIAFSNPNSPDAYPSGWIRSGVIAQYTCVLAAPVFLWPSRRIGRWFVAMAVAYLTWALFGASLSVAGWLVPLYVAGSLLMGPGDRADWTKRTAILVGSLGLAYLAEQILGRLYPDDPAELAYMLFVPGATLALAALVGTRRAQR